MKLKNILFICILVLTGNQLIAQCNCTKPLMFVHDTTICNRRQTFNSIKKSHIPNIDSSIDITPDTFQKLTDLLNNTPSSTGIRIYFAAFTKLKSGSVANSYIPANCFGNLTVVFVLTDNLGKNPPYGHDISGTYKTLNLNNNPATLESISDADATVWINNYQNTILQNCQNSIEMGNQLETKSLWYPKSSIKDAAVLINCINTNQCATISDVISKIKIVWAAYSVKEVNTDKLYSKQLSLIFLLKDKNDKTIDISNLPAIKISKLMGNGLDTATPCPPNSCDGSSLNN